MKIDVGVTLHDETIITTAPRRPEIFKVVTDGRALYSGTDAGGRRRGNAREMGLMNYDFNYTNNNALAIYILLPPLESET